jgi:hypothetical protein
MLKIGNQSLKGLFLISCLVAVFFLAQPLLAKARISGPEEERLSLLSDRSLQSAARKPVPAPGQLSQPLPEKLHHWLSREIGLEHLEDFVLNSQAILDSPGFDLYLLDLWLEGRPLAALALLDNQLERAGDDPARLNQAGAFLFSCGEYELAKDFFLAVYNRWPDQPSILNNLAANFLALGSRKEAARLYRHCLELAPYHPEANLALYYLSTGEGSDQPDQDWLIRALQGAFREKVSRLIGTSSWPLPLCFEQEINLSLPPLPASFEQYISLLSIYQEALFELSQREQALSRELSGRKQLPGTESISGQTERRGKSWQLNSAQSYRRLLEAEGRLDWLEREAEKPAELSLEQIVTASVQALDSVYKAYRRQEQKALEAPPASRAEELKKARDYYCFEYKKEATRWYRKYRERLLTYFEQAEQELKTFSPQFYFWLRYLPENQQTTRRLETELRLIKIYSRLWEKAVLLQTRLGQPAFPDCLPALEPSPEDRVKPVLPLQSPVADLQLAFTSEVFSFILSPGQLACSASLVLADFPEKRAVPSATIYLYPPATTASVQPIYLAVDEQGRLNDLGKIDPRAAGHEPFSSSFRIVFNLSYPPQSMP